MKMKKMIYLMFALLLMSATSMKAQVAIGVIDPNNPTELNPHSGAILDLRQVYNNKLGLLLPKVALEAHNVWTLEGTKVDGMLVYNDNDDATTTNGLNGKGAYIWYDNSWHKLGLSGDTPNIVKDYDGNSYKYACFGDAGCWMQENLKTTHYADGTLISYKNGSNNSSGNNDLKEFDYPNRNDQSTAYGLLYTWAAATNRTGISNDEGNTDQTAVQGICPTGWHLPSDKEWSLLEYVIDKDDAYNYSTSTANTGSPNYYTSTTWLGMAGKKMKSVNKVDGGADPKGTSNDIGAGGFDWLLAGCVNQSGSMGNYGNTSFMWSDSSGSELHAWGHCVTPSQDGLRRQQQNKTWLFSVRCKKDS